MTPGGRNSDIICKHCGPDIVFNIAEGILGRGRESQVPALLDFYRIPYTGSDETTLCISLDKALIKRIVSSYGIRTPKYCVICCGQDDRCSGGRFHYPLIVKPNAEGSSKGISDTAVVTDRKQLKELVSRNISLYRQDMLVEEYIEGREFIVGIFGNGEDIHVFPPMEICWMNRINRYNIYSYNVKQNYEQIVRYECPANIGKETEAEITDTAKHKLSLRGGNENGKQCRSITGTFASRRRVARLEMAVQEQDHDRGATGESSPSKRKREAGYIRLSQELSNGDHSLLRIPYGSGGSEMPRPNAGDPDSAETMRELVLKLVKICVRPYYLYQCDLSQGLGHFRTEVEKGVEIINKLQGYISGFAVPKFVIDSPHGGGKIPINPEYVLSDDDEIVMRNYADRIYTYPHIRIQN